MSQIPKTGLKTLAAILTVGRRSRKNVDWTMVIAICSTAVTVSLIALYVFQDSVDF